VKQVGGEASPAEGAISAALFSLPPPLALPPSPSRISLAFSLPLPLLLRSRALCSRPGPLRLPPPSPGHLPAERPLEGPLGWCLSSPSPCPFASSPSPSLFPLPPLPSPLSPVRFHSVLATRCPVPEPRSPICPVRSFTSVDGGFPGERPLRGARRVLAVPSFSLKIACFLALIRRCSELTPWSEVVRPRFFARLHFHVLSCFLMVF